jgi:hypothetical protein
VRVQDSPSALFAPFDDELLPLQPPAAAANTSATPNKHEIADPLIMKTSGALDSSVD